MKSRKLMGISTRPTTLVTRLGTVSLEIIGKNIAHVRCLEALPVESGRFFGSCRLERMDGGKWSGTINQWLNSVAITPRREQLVLKAITRALKNIPEERFKKVEKVNINNAIVVLTDNIKNCQKRLEELLIQEYDLDHS